VKPAFSEGVVPNSTKTELGYGDDAHLPCNPTLTVAIFPTAPVNQRGMAVGSVATMYVDWVVRV
jgi:hypothetical protein